MFRYSGRIPATFIIGADGVVQDYQSGANPNIVAELTQKIEKLLAGENIFEAPIQAYQQEMKQYASRLEKESAASDEEFEREEPKMEEQRLPEIAPAERSAPASFKLAPLWKCEELKSPGNVYVLAGKDETPRLLVVEGSLSVAEVGLDGKLIANHELQLNAEQGEAISNLRIFTTADGKHLVVAFAGAQQRLHLFDENWKHTLSYPEDALKRPHSGIADVELADLQGSGSPQICVGYWGIVGVQAVSPNGERLWSNRSLANVIRMAVGDPDEKGRRNLFCTNNGNNAGAIVALDAAGERRGEIAIPNRPLHTLVAADLAGNGHSSWCGLSATKLGEDVAVGFSLEGEELWNYALPQGPHPRPIELILSGKLLPNGPGQWILPGADGSIHVLSPEGKLLERFNYGETLQGLTVVEIGGKPALIVATAKGLETLSVE
jgi:hypothetical protein